MLLQEGTRVDVVLAGNATKDTICVLDSFAGVYMATGVTGATVPVSAGNGEIHQLTKAASAVSAFAVGDKVYALTATSAPTTSASSSVPLGMAVEACTTTATSFKVRLCTF